MHPTTSHHGAPPQTAAPLPTSYFGDRAPARTVLAAATAGDEGALLAGLRRRDPQAFETLVRCHGGRLLAVARRILGNEEDARDALQDALLGALRGLDRFDGRSRLATWLHRIVTNAALMKLRARRRRPELPLADTTTRGGDGEAPAEPPAATVAPDGERSLLREEERRRVRHAIDRLPEAYRAALLLRDVEELSTREAARLLGINENALKIRLHRARRALLALLRS